jgi:hypothetical protein
LLLRRISTMAFGVMLGVLLGAVPATAESTTTTPPNPSTSATAALLAKPLSTLTPEEFRARAEFNIDMQSREEFFPVRRPWRRSLGSVQALVGPGVTVGWPNRGVGIFAVLFRPNNTESGEDRNFCSADHSCTISTHFTDCTCQHGTWQLYVTGSQGGTERPPACKFDPVRPPPSANVPELQRQFGDGRVRPGSFGPVAVSVAVKHGGDTLSLNHP